MGAEPHNNDTTEMVGMTIGAWFSAKAMRGQRLAQHSVHNQVESRSWTVHRARVTRQDRLRVGHGRSHRFQPHGQEATSTAAKSAAA